MLGEEVYYRIYAERQHVVISQENTALLLDTAFKQYYAPPLFWVTLAPAPMVASELVIALSEPKHPLVLSAVRALVLLGVEATTWLGELLDKRYASVTQPPEFYWTFN